MSSLGVALPLRLSDRDGFVMIKSFHKLVKQNFKMLMLTIPGERIMEPEYGVGLKQYLFENYHSNVYGEIERKIREQVKIYIPAITIDAIHFNTSSPDTSTLGISINYSIPQLSIHDLLEFTI